LITDLFWASKFVSVKLESPSRAACPQPDSHAKGGKCGKFFWGTSCVIEATVGFAEIRIVPLPVDPIAEYQYRLYEPQVPTCDRIDEPVWPQRLFPCQPSVGE
jgi:hypothetical protein